MLGAGSQMTKARASSWTEPRAFSAAARVRTPARCRYARDARRCPVPRLERASGCPKALIGCTTAPAVGSRCGSAGAVTAAIATAPAAVRGCAEASRCAVPGGVTSAAFAGRAATRRARQDKVTHHGSPTPTLAATVSAPVIEFRGAPNHDDIAEVGTHSFALAYAAPRCSFCRRALSAFTRLGLLRGGA
jgi:hypothetical protein